MLPNKQPPSALAVDTDRILVHSIWPTIQGEGPLAGTMAIFIRLAGCNLQCPFCDTEYTKGALPYSFNTGSLPNVEDLLRQVVKMTPVRPPAVIGNRQLVVITGGEPFRQNVVPLVNELTASGFAVQLETNGTLGFTEPMHSRAVVVCSPKTPKINSQMALRANAYKYVLDADHVDPNDGLPSGTLGAYGQTARPPFDWHGDVFVSPLDQGEPAANERNVQACVNSVLRFGYRLSLQLHKIVNVA